MRATPTVLHLDLDAFFAAVEQRDKPSLRGKPVVVGGIGPRGVVSTASYEARAFGIGSAMPTAEARRRCPNAAYLAGRFAAYRAASDVVMGVLRALSPLVEPLSLDEAYVDLAPALGDADADVDAVTAVAQRLRRDITAATGLTASVGAGTSKLVAKIGSDLNKPDGLTVVAPGEEAATLAPLPVRRLPGIGPASEERLRRRHLATIGDLAALDLDELVELLGRAHGTGVHAAVRGLDDRAVVPEREAKSASAEQTFATDLTDRRLLADHARRLTDRVAERLQRHGISGRTVTLKLRRYDFSTITRSVTLPQPTDSAPEIASAAVGLLNGVDTSDGVRLLGVGVSGLTDYAQQVLLADLDQPAEEGPPDDEAQRFAVQDLMPHWVPGQDVRHDELGAGWVQGAGIGRVTVRFEGPHTAVGPVRTFSVDDPALAPADPPPWAPLS